VARIDPGGRFRVSGPSVRPWGRARWRRCLVAVGAGLLLLLSLGSGAAPGRRTAPGARGEALWTLLLQVPLRGDILIERSGTVLRGAPERLAVEARRGPSGARSVRRVVVGEVSVESRRVREVTLAGQVLIVTVSVPAGRRVRPVSTNRLPISEVRGHLALLNLQLVVEGDLNARAPFAIVDEPGRTAVLFQ
jgi:hypothetical protein